MSYIAHDAIIATVNYGPRPDIEAFCEALPPEWRPLVIGPVAALVNDSTTYAFLPDGSKEWSDTSNDGDRYREEFAAIFGSDADVVSVRFGGDFGIERGPVVEELDPSARLSADVQRGTQPPTPEDQ